jgi:hypothetical protein
VRRDDLELIRPRLSDSAGSSTIAIAQRDGLVDFDSSAH